MTKALDLVRKVQRGEAPPPPIATLIGFTLAEVDPGRAVITLDAGPRHLNPMGTMHGGVLCDIADAAMGMAYAASLDDGESFTTLELKINYFKPVFTGTLRAVAKLVRPGKTVGYVECDVLDAGGKLVAKSSSTCMTLRGDMAKGR